MKKCEKAWKFYHHNIFPALWAFSCHYKTIDSTESYHVILHFYGKTNRGTGIDKKSSSTVDVRLFKSNLNFIIDCLFARSVNGIAIKLLHSSHNFFSCLFVHNTRTEGAKICLKMYLSIERFIELRCAFLTQLYAPFESTISRFSLPEILSLRIKFY